VEGKGENLSTTRDHRTQTPPEGADESLDVSTSITSVRPARFRTHSEAARVEVNMAQKPVSEKYEIGTLIGKGAYGKVKQIRDKKTKKLYAVKILTPSRLRNIPGGEDSLLREISIMKRIDHKNCIQYIDYWSEEYCKKKCYLVLEYVGGGSLQELFDQKIQLPIYQTRKLFQQLIRALKHLHGLGIVHRDVKPENIMLTDKMQLKLSDFGIADFIDNQEDEENPRKRCHGSPAFMAPEMAKSSIPTTGQDIWAAGIVFYQMCFNKYPFTIETKGSVKTILDNLCLCKFTIPESADPTLSHLLNGILQMDPKKRYTISQIKQHP